jgi:hypothetical protein
MRIANLMSLSLLSAVLSTGVAEASLAQGGWRQWEVRLRWRDGATTVGRITLAHVRWSEGVVVQRGDTVDLRDVAYLVFAPPDSASTTCQCLRRAGTSLTSRIRSAASKHQRFASATVGRNAFDECS